MYQTMNSTLTVASKDILALFKSSIRIAYLHYSIDDNTSVNKNKQWQELLMLYMLNKEH